MHRGPRLVHDRAHPDPHGAVGRRGSRRPERPDEADTPTIAEFYKKNGYQTYFSGKWHLGDVPKFYPINHGFDEMKQFAAYYPGVYAYSDTAHNAHPVVPEIQQGILGHVSENREPLRMGRHGGQAGGQGRQRRRDHAGEPADFDVRQTDSAVEYIKKHAKDGKPFFMSVNFMGMHQPTSPNKAFMGKSHLGNYSDKMMEMDANIGRIMDAIRAEAPDTIVIHTADNGAWQDAWPDAGTNPFRGEKGTRLRRGLPRAGHHVGAGQDSGRAGPQRDDVAHGRVAHDRDDGRPHPAAPRCMEGQRRQADLFRRH